MYSFKLCYYFKGYLIYIVHKVCFNLLSVCFTVFNISQQMVLVCYVISHNRMIKGSCDLVSYYSVTFNDHRHSGSGEIMFLLCQIVTQGHVIKGSFDLMSVPRHGKSPPCQVGDHKYCNWGDIMVLVVEVKGFICFRLNSNYCLSLKYLACHIKANGMSY